MPWYQDISYHNGDQYKSTYIQDQHYTTKYMDHTFIRDKISGTLHKIH